MSNGDNGVSLHAYVIVVVSLKTGEKLKVAQNGTGIYHDLHLDGAVHEVTVPQENISKITPHPLPCREEKAGVSLEKFYFDVVIKGLYDEKFLKACVISKDTKEFEKALHALQCFEDLEKIGGISIDELIIHELWKFIGILAKHFIYLPHHRKQNLLNLLKEKSPTDYQEAVKPRFTDRDYT